MVLPASLEIGLVVSITAIIVVSLLTLYLHDRLMNRVEYLERTASSNVPAITASPTTATEIVPQRNALPEFRAEESENSPGGVSGIYGERGEKEILRADPNSRDRDEGEQHGGETLEKILDHSPKFQVLIDEVSANNARINALSNDLVSTNTMLDQLGNSVSERNRNLENLERDLSKVTKKLELTEDTITTIIRKTFSK
ncbi:MAG: hypothetical protein ACRDF4_03915 [Rhabdochlamydiaceae bacterium]